MSEQLNILHRLTSARCSYERRKEHWSNFRIFAASVVSDLPFRWHAVQMDNPTQNHTGYTNGRSHIVLDEAIAIGRLRRDAGQALCAGGTANLWGDVIDGQGVTCKRCLEVAERMKP